MIRKRIVAFLLCMAMVISNTTVSSAMEEAGTQVEIEETVEEVTSEEIVEEAATEENTTEEETTKEEVTTEEETTEESVEETTTEEETSTEEETTEEEPTEEGKGDSVSDNTVSDNTLSGNTLSENALAIGLEPFTITIQHYLADSETGAETSGIEIFKEDTIDCEAGKQIITGFEKDNENYRIEKVVKIEEDGTETELELETEGGIEVSEETTLRIYYTATSGTLDSKATFFDYSTYTKEYGKDFWGNQVVRYTKGINSDENYPRGSKRSQRLAMGQDSSMDWPGGNDIRHGYRLFVDIEENGRTYHVNANTHNTSGISGYGIYFPIVDGMIPSLSGSNYETPVFGLNSNGDKIVDPAFFTSENKKGKAIYANQFSLNFEREGDNYVLMSVTDNKTNQMVAGTNALGKEYENKFFPLDKVPSAQPTSCSNGHNPMFGMRYDFKFSLGDYIGPLDYTFVGDDDLWVFLDGKCILDLGGIHSPYPDTTFPQYEERFEECIKTWPNTVDLWDELEKNADGTYDTEKEHIITVLFMERGDYDSNCNMSFTIPSVKKMNPIVTPEPITDISLVKTEEGNENKKLSGACFRLSNRENEKDSMEEITDSNGRITFQGVERGSYFLEEVRAPEGYQPSPIKWLVEVSGSSKEDISYRIYELDAENQKGKEVSKLFIEGSSYYCITNKPYMVEPKVSKTAVLRDWEERTYDIQIAVAAESHTSLENEQVVIVDYIDEHFELCKPDKTKVYTEAEILAAGNQIILSDGGILSVETTGKKRQFITWSNLTVKELPEKGKKVITVKAKESFLGDNAVPTNGNESKVTIMEKDTKLPVPLVNVKAEFTANEAESVIFKGETLEGYLTEEKITEIFDKEKFADSQFVLEWFEKQEEDGQLTSPISVEDIKKKGTEGVFYLKISYVPSNPTEESTNNSKGNIVTMENAYAIGTYTVKVISGELIIHKQIAKADFKEFEGDPVFSFRITKLAQETEPAKVFYKTLRFSKDEVKGTLGKVTLQTSLKELPKGTYVIEELPTLGFSLKEENGIQIVTEETNCTNSHTNDSASFTLGKNFEPIAGTNPIAYSQTKGSVLFSNEKNRNDGKLTHTDVVKNSFVLQGDGTIHKEEKADNE